MTVFTCQTVSMQVNNTKAINSDREFLNTTAALIEIGVRINVQCCSFNYELNIFLIMFQLYSKKNPAVFSAGFWV